MLNESKTINKYPVRAKFMTNFAATDWLTNRVKEVNKQGKPRRVARYKGISPERLLLEEPTVLDRSAGYFHSTVVVRKNGLCIHDPKIKFITFPQFLTGIDPNKTFYNKAGITKELTFHELVALVEETTDFPSVASYALTNIAGSDKYALIVTSAAMTVDLDAICDLVFDGYNFEEITGYALETEDKKYPTTEQTTLDGYLVGSITVKDILLKEETATIDIFNLYTIKNILGDTIRRYNGSYYYDGQIDYRPTPSSRYRAAYR